MLASALGGRLGVEVSIRDVPLSADEVSARSGEESVWLSTFSALVDVVSTSEVGYLCVTEPEPAPKARPNDAPEVARAIGAAATAPARAFVRPDRRRLRGPMLADPLLSARRRRGGRRRQP
jgi:hypothetical protein